MAKVILLAIQLRVPPQKGLDFPWRMTKQDTWSSLEIIVIYRCINRWQKPSQIISDQRRGPSFGGYCILLTDCRNCSCVGPSRITHTTLKKTEAHQHKGQRNDSFQQQLLWHGSLPPLTHTQVSLGWDGGQSACSTPNNSSPASASAKLQGLEEHSADPMEKTSPWYRRGQLVTGNWHPTDRLWHAQQYKESCVSKLFWK